MRVLLDVFSVLSIKKCLLKKLPDTFYLEVMIGLNNSVPASIAAETDDLKVERKVRRRSYSR